jgi:hypothetical protein
MSLRRVCGGRWRQVCGCMAAAACYARPHTGTRQQRGTTDLGLAAAAVVGRRVGRMSATEQQQLRAVPLCTAALGS